MDLHVAVVDYGDPEAPMHLARSLRTSGFAVLRGHPLSAELVRTVQEEWLAFLGSDAKWAYRPVPGAQDGYFPLEATETAVGATVADVKEYFHWYPWARHPAEVGPAAGELHSAATALAVELLGWLDAATPAEVLAGASMPLCEMLRGSTRSLLRILRYPPVTGHEAPGALRAAPHEDINLLTMLPAASQPGLQVLDQAGTWHDVPCDPGTLVVNTGDMLARVTDGYYPSTTHRVLLPDGPQGRMPRMSTPLFLHAADDVELTPGVTAFAFLRQRLLQISGTELGG